MEHYKHFGMIDLQEAYDLIGLVKVDFDHSYPQHTERLNAFVERHKYVHLGKVATAFDRMIIVHIEKTDKIYYYRINTPRFEIIPVISFIINAVNPTTIGEVTHIINNVDKEAIPVDADQI